MRKVKKDNLVGVIAGKDEDKTGKVITMNTKVGTILIEGYNMVTKHVKPSAGNPNGGIISQEGPIDVSSVMLVVDGKATKVSFEVGDGKKVRIVKATGRVTD